jgi:polysaccharide export outer membrane protein
MRLSLVLALLAMTGCGAAYISPSVKETDDGSVDVVLLTSASVAVANKSSYAPQKLPSVFRHVASAPAARTAGALPSQVAVQENRPAVIESRIPAAIGITPYVIGVADVILLATQSTGNTVAELSGLLAAQNKRQGYTVQDDGAIAIPDVGRIRVGGLTLEAAEAEVFQALVAAQINPTFSVEVSEFNSQRVSVGGAVANPSLVPISLKPLYLEEALQLAGGVSAADLDYSTLRLYRDGTLFQIPVRELYAKTKLKRILLKDGDSVFVDTQYDLVKAKAYFEEQITLLQLRQSARSQAISELNAEFSLRQAQSAEARANFTTRVDLGSIKRDYVYLTGELTQQSRFPLPFDNHANLADALFSNHGFSTRESNPSQIYVLRGNKHGDKVTAYQLDARNAANMILATRLELRPNDVVFVSEQPVTKWNRLFSQIIPSLVFQTAAAIQP